MTVNPSKSHALIIPPKLNKSFPAIEISINNSPISLRNNVKYLEVTIDSSLKFETHISTIAHKTSRAAGIISRLRHHMPTNALLKIYYSLIHSQLLYGLPVWGSTYTSCLYKLITIQNKAVKLIGGGRLLDSPSPFYSKFRILKLFNLYNLEIGKLVHAHFSNKLPSPLSNYFALTSQVSDRNTRLTQTKKKLLYIPRYSTNRLQRCIKYQRVKIWNDIPLDIQNSSSKLFKTKFKKHLIQNYD